MYFNGEKLYLYGSEQSETTCSVHNVFQWENLDRAVRNVLGENLEKRNLRTINEISVAMSKLMQGAAQYAKSAPKGAPRKVHQDAAQNTSKSAPRRRNFYEKGAPKGAHMAFSFL